MTLVAFLLVAAAASAGCGSDDGATPNDGGSSTSVTSFEERTFDTWRVGDDARGSAIRVTGTLRQTGACSQIEIGSEQHAVTWPPGTRRTKAGISTGDHLYRFDHESEFSVVKDYDGPQRPVTCLTTEAWLVIR